MKTFDYESMSLDDFEAHQEAQLLLPASRWADEAWERIESGPTMHGDPLPWPKTHDLFRMRPGEVTLWFGYSQHKKSLVVGQVMLWLLDRAKVVIASMEMQPPATIERISRQATGDKPTRRYHDWVMKYTDDRLWLYDEADTVEPRRILAMVNYSVQILGAKHIVIDSLMKCIAGEDDYNGQKNFVDSLCQAAKRHNVHIHLVHHARKGQGKDSEDTPPSKHDARGAAVVTDLVDNVIAVHTNRRKAKSQDAGDEVDESLPDLSLYVWKQRHGEFSDAGIGLYWHEAGRQITQRPGAPMVWRPGEQFGRA